MDRSMLVMVAVNVCATSALVALAVLGLTYGIGALALGASACVLAALVASEVAS